MSVIEDYSFVRYLSSKKSIDDRALNRFVWDNLVAVLRPTSPQSPLRVLELGAGIGTMVERLIDWGLLTRADYTSVEINADCIEEFWKRIGRWTSSNGFELIWDSAVTACIQRGKSQICVNLIKNDVYDFFETKEMSTKWDLGLAHAFMDLVDIADVLPKFCSLIKPGGLLYLTLTYDGETILMPKLDRHLDDHILQLYNQSMDERLKNGRKSGNSQAGRHLFHHLKKANTKILAAGSSDWVVFAKEQGYANDESYFLHYIIHTIQTELNGHLSLTDKELESWVQKRHAQIEKGELNFIAKPLDFLAQGPTDGQ
ncbi:MAG: class I SAM-dependent methyltransferase [bacterium]